MHEYNREYRQRPEVKDRRRQRERENYHRPEVKERRRKSCVNTCVSAA